MLPLRVRAYEVAGKKYYVCPFSLGSVMKHSTRPFPFAKAMDALNQFFFLIILASFTNGKLEDADLQKVASQLKVTHYDCGEMTQNNLYGVNQVKYQSEQDENSWFTNTPTLEHRKRPAVFGP